MACIFRLSKCLENNVLKNCKNEPVFNPVWGNICWGNAVVFAVRAIAFCAYESWGRDISDTMYSERVPMRNLPPHIPMPELT